MTVPSFDYTSYGENCGHEWENWLRSFEFCMEASHIENDDEKYVRLLHFAGRKVTRKLFDELNKFKYKF